MSYLVDLELRRGQGHMGVYLSQKINNGGAQVQFKWVRGYRLYVSKCVCMWKLDQGPKFLIFRKPSNRSVLKKKY